MRIYDVFLLLLFAFPPVFSLARFLGNKENAPNPGAVLGIVLCTAGAAVYMGMLMYHNCFF